MKKMGQSVNKSIKASNDSIDTLNDQINHFKEIKQHLHEFDAKSSSFMADAQSLISMATKGINEINSGLNPKTGESILPDDSQLTWIDDVNEKVSKYDSRKEQFINVMSDTYGLDDEDAKDLYELQQGIEKYAKEHGKSPVWALSEYNRIIASLGGYDTESKKGMAQWSQAMCVTREQARKLCKKYGLSNKQINSLYNKNNPNAGLRGQHNNAGVKKDLAHESVIIASYANYKQYFEGDLSDKQRTILMADTMAVEAGGVSVGAHITKNNMNIMGDSPAEINGTTLDIEIEPSFDDNVSYRGDIMSGSKKASNSDFASDIDAENIYNRAKKSSTVREALDTSTKYNRGIETGKINRKEEFLNNHGGLEHIENVIDSWTPEDFFLKGDATEQEIKKAKKDFKKFLKQKQTGIESLFN